MDGSSPETDSIEEDKNISYEVVSTEGDLLRLTTSTIEEKLVQLAAYAKSSAESANSDDPRFVNRKPIFAEEAQNSTTDLAMQLNILKEVLKGGLGQSLPINHNDPERPVIELGKIKQNFQPNSETPTLAHKQPS